MGSTMGNLAGARNLGAPAPAVALFLDYITMGGGMAMSHQMLKEVVECDECYCPSANMADDMMVGHWVGHELNYPLSHEEGFHQAQMDAYHPRVLAAQEVISFHKFPQDLSLSGAGAIDLKAVHKLYDSMLKVPFDVDAGVDAAGGGVGAAAMAGPEQEGGQLEKALPHNLSEKERAVELAVQQQRLAEMNQELETATEQAEQEAKARALEGDVNVDAQQEKGPEGL
jgi:hypothetical protein